MMNEKEVYTAWRLWHLLEELSSGLWERYEKEFMELCIDEEDRRHILETEGDQFPF